MSLQYSWSVNSSADSDRLCGTTNDIRDTQEQKSMMLWLTMNWLGKRERRDLVLRMTRITRAFPRRPITSMSAVVVCRLKFKVASCNWVLFAETDGTV